MNYKVGDIVRYTNYKKDDFFYLILQKKQGANCFSYYDFLSKNVILSGDFSGDYYTIIS